MSKKEIIAILLLVAVAIVRFFFFTPEKPDYDFALNNKVSIEGIVSNFPDVRLNNQRIIIKPDNQESNILVVLPNEVNVFYGDRIKVTGILDEPENFITQNGREFNYKRYLSNKDIYYIVKNAESETISKNNGSKIKLILFRIRKYFSDNLNKMILYPRSDLARGLILGEKGSFDSDLKNDFITTGTIHIVALSGYNISVIANNVMKFLGVFFSSMFCIIFAFIIVVLFVIMTGAEATAVRAGIMASILLLSKISGRTYYAGRTLVIAGLLMLTYDPRVINDMSFQLSFLATAGILYLNPKISKTLNFIPEKFNLRESFSTTISATISVLPLLLYSTGILSIVSLPANILILPSIPYAMFFSFLTSITTFISQTIAYPFAFISDLILSYILLIIKFFSSVSFASTNVKSFPVIILILSYAIIIYFTFFYKSKDKNFGTPF